MTLICFYELQCTYVTNNYIHLYKGYCYTFLLGTTVFESGFAVSETRAHIIYCKMNNKIIIFNC